MFNELSVAVEPVTDDVELVLSDGSEPDGAAARSSITYLTPRL